MATCPGQRMMEATRGNGYAPVRGSLTIMMMMMIMTTMRKRAEKKRADDNSASWRCRYAM